MQFYGHFVTVFEKSLICFEIQKWYRRLGVRKKGQFYSKPPDHDTVIVALHELHW